MAGTRLPAPRIGSVASALTGGDLKAFTDLVRRFPILDGQEITFTLDGSGNVQNVPHGLGRPFRGVLILGVTNTSVVVTAGDVQNAINADVDPAKYVRINPSTTLAVDVTIWVY